MKTVVTGAAGFIGSHLCRRLLQEGFEVTGIDSFEDYYPREIKEKNIRPLLRHRKFSFLAENLDRLNLRAGFQDADVVFHLAAQAGVRASWGTSFSVYLKNNIKVTQRLLEAAKSMPRLQKFVYASSSSVYGTTLQLPTSETHPVRPVSPYGVTKLAAEQLAYLYHENYDVPTVSLRFFTVYGPAQRPDMAFHKFFKAMAENKEILVYGTGGQTRDFTFVEDIVEANLAAMRQGRPGETYNVGGGHREKLTNVIALMEEISGRKALLTRMEKQKGDVPDTMADIRKAGKDLAYKPRTRLEDGLRQEWLWIKELYRA
ncbi:MAG: GDP-mannose 4,6-dehydratase [Acidobacteriota bacterium]|nr:GDP-mannose 4,6-dehydratase [Acidobacteriota bacterium]